MIYYQVHKLILIQFNTMVNNIKDIEPKNYFLYHCMHFVIFCNHYEFICIICLI